MSKHRYYYDRVTMALDDLFRCRRYCELMLMLPLGKAFSEDRTAYEALFVAFIVSHGRVFSTSNTVDLEFKETVSQSFGDFRAKLMKAQEDCLQKLHDRILDKRNQAIAHSDGESRNYHHHNDSPLAAGRNPYFPYEHEEVEQALVLVNNLASQVGEEQQTVGKYAFSRALFRGVEKHT